MTSTTILGQLAWLEVHELVGSGWPTSRWAVRDTKQEGTGPVLPFAPGAWREFAGQLKRS